MKVNYDYSNFDPDAQVEYNSYTPPEGEYELYIVEVLEKNNEKLGGDFAEIEFMGADLYRNKLPSTFTQSYMVNHSNPDVARIAFETLGRLYCKVKNIKNPPNSWDIQDLKGGLLKAEVKHNHKNDKVYASLRRIESIGQSESAQQAQPVQQQQPAQQAQTYGKPTWA